MVILKVTSFLLEHKRHIRMTFTINRYSTRIFLLYIEEKYKMKLFDSATITLDPIGKFIVQRRM
jgi:hypothetical protein